VKGDVLEHNVRRLLRKSYVPALPTPAFRDRLEALFLDELRRRTLPGRRRRAPVLRLSLAAAAAVAALFLGWRFLAGAPAGREELLAHGNVALGLPDGRWRAASAEERAHGVAYAAPSLVAATPEQASLRVLVADAGELLLHERSAAVLETRADGLHARLELGRAEWLDAGGERALAPGEDTRLERAPAPEAPEDARAPADVARREPVPELTPEAPAEPEPAQRALLGRVVDAASGAPVTRFTVALLRERVGNETYPPERRDFEAEDGRFRWPDPPSGKQRLFVHAPDYALCAAGELDLTQPRGDELVLELGRGADVRGLVLDEAGAPVPDALVISENEAPTDGLFFVDSEQLFWLPIQARSGPDGRFELRHLGPGLHTLRATARDLAPVWALGVSVPATELVLRLGPGGTIAGRVTGADGGPSAGVEIVVVAMDQVQHTRMNFGVTRTDAQGEYRFERLPPTTMIVVRLGSGDRPEVVPVQVRVGQVARADFSDQRTGARVQGRLLDVAGRPIAQQNLGLFMKESSNWDQDWVASTTRDDGTFAFEGVAPGPYLVFLIDEMGKGVRCVDELVVPTEWPEVAHDVRVPGGALTLRVRSAATGAPVPAAGVVLVHVDGGVSFSSHGGTDERGEFTFRDLRSGTYMAEVYPTTPGLGYRDTGPIEVDEAGPAPTLAVELGEGGPVTVRVTTGDGRPLEGALVSFRDEAGAEHNFGRLPATGDDGRYKAHGLRAGTYRAQARLAGYQGAPVTFRYEPGLELEIPLVLTPVPPK